MAAIKKIFKRTVPFLLALCLVTGNAVAVECIWPTNPASDYLSRGYIYGTHTGLDICAELGTDVVAAADGIVCYVWSGCVNFSGYAYSGTSCAKLGKCNSSEEMYGGFCNHGLGNAVVLRHGNNTWTVYGHLDTIASGITAGMEVKQGQAIGTMGSSGRSTGVHLHFGYKSGGDGDFWSASYRDPKPYISASAVRNGIVPYGVSIVAARHYINAGDTLEFTLTSVSATSEIIKIEGNGKTVCFAEIGEERVFSFRFSEMGNYTVTYTAQNASGKVSVCENVTVYPDNTELPDGDAPAEGKYFDLSGHWAEDQIELLDGYGIFDDGEFFKPDGEMTRAMFVTVLGRLYEYSNGTVEKVSGAGFSDVNESRWYAGYVAWAAECGLVNGYGDGTFRPDKNIERQQMAVIMCRYIDILGYSLNLENEPMPFTDDGQIGEYAREAVERMQMAGIMTGRENGIFSPEDSATRAETAVMLLRLIENVGI